ncbi:DUF262 domain-containing protein [Flavobacterium sp. 7A]|uniref:DUF262 domain-containing protein n=1 Tax=Flavobacterium sp. 7A TaxID=2940571 RepID=UPI0022277F65|nr:DUF262 domain-containing protein [Flavobacterium sp. 7A]MCW2119787.1 hypothetical protein [Flavobacterium sp. 7A]
MENTMTFWNLISDKKICIPIIQRDYAQGRKEEKRKRNGFLKSLHKHLTGKETNALDLDFIYGRVNNDTFYPIDGQQRLTTLFLLHWYLSLKENINISDRIILKKFIYDTRISSREFCAALLDEEIQIPLTSIENNLTEEITNKYWFRSSWLKDPTIKAMLIMLQAIHEKFKSCDGNIWEKLTNNSNIISFQILDLGKKGFELTDELYIKMNARGKQLTSFENFKASFIQFIENEFKYNKLKHPIKGEISYAGYFSYKIEKEWTDLLWAFRENKTVIDSLFLKYFTFIAQMCYFKDNINAKQEDYKFDKYKEVFKVEANILFLFNSLDKLYEISSNNFKVNRTLNQDFFESIFKNEENDGVLLFWNSSGKVNLLEHCILDGDKNDNNNQIIFYCLLNYLIKHDQKFVGVELKKYLRLVRNFLQYARQKNDTKYNTDVRINRFGSYWILFERLATSNVYQTLLDTTQVKGTFITDTTLKNEQNKVQMIIDYPTRRNEINSLENIYQFEGLIHLLKLNENISELEDYIKTINNIWNKNITDTLKIQALIACGFKGIYTKNCKMGEMWYFGKTNNWKRVLTTDDVDVSNAVETLLLKYNASIKSSPKEKLEEIVSNWLLENEQNRSWKYYFLKYNNFTSGLNYYAWPSDFEIRILGTDGSNPLVAHHINPFVLTVCKRINNKQICDEDNCKQQYSGNSPLILKNGSTMTCSNDGWIIDDIAENIDETIISEFNLISKDKKFLLKDSLKKDRIEIAVEFINKIY